MGRKKMAGKVKKDSQKRDSWVFSSGFDGNGDYFEWIIERLGEDEFEIHCETMEAGATDCTRGSWDSLESTVREYSEGYSRFDLSEFLKEIGRAEVYEEDEDPLPTEPAPEPERPVLPAVSDSERKRFYEDLQREIERLESTPAHGFGNAGAWQAHEYKCRREYERTFGVEAPAWVQELTWMANYLRMSVDRGIPLPEEIEVKK